MFIIKPIHSILSKAIAIAVVCLFVVNWATFAIPNSLSPLAGNLETYTTMRQEMQRKYDLHNTRDIDPFILSHLDRIYSLTGRIDPINDFAAERIAVRSALEEALTNNGAGGLLNRIENKTNAFNKATGKIEKGVQIQLLVLKNDEKFPIFEGEEVRGHASNKYLTIFVKENELSDISSNMSSIVGKIFHEIRARSHRPDQELKEFEKINQRIESEIRSNGYIADSSLRREFARLEFPQDLDIMHRDYKAEDSSDTSPSLRMTNRLAQRLSLEQKQEMVLAQLCETMLKNDTELLASIEEGRPLQDDDLTRIEEELRIRVKEELDEYDGLAKKRGVQTEEFDDMVEAMIASIVADTRVRAAMRLRQPPEVVDLRTQMMADMAKVNLKATNAGNLFFVRKDGVYCMTYDLLHLLKYFSLAPIFYTKTEFDEISKVSERIMKTVPEARLEEMVRGDLEQFIRCAEEAISWIDEKWVENPSKGGLAIISTEYSKYKKAEFLRMLRALKDKARSILAVSGDSPSEKMRRYIKLYADTVATVNTMSENIGLSVIWTHLDTGGIGELYKYLKMPTTKGRTVLLGPSLSGVPEGQFTRVVLVSIPKSEKCPKAADIVSVGGDFNSWMAEEAFLHYAIINGMLATDEIWDDMKKNATIIPALAFRFGGMTKFIAMGPEKMKRPTGDRIRRKAGVLGIVGENMDVIFEPNDVVLERALSAPQAPPQPYITFKAMTHDFEAMVLEITKRGKIPIVVSDMDATITPSGQPISEENLQIIINILEQRIPIAILSGALMANIDRQLIDPLLKKIPRQRRSILNNLMIGSNGGAQIYRYSSASGDFSSCIFSLDMKQELSPELYAKIPAIINECVNKFNVKQMLSDVMGMKFDDDSWAALKSKFVDERPVAGRPGEISQVTFAILGKGSTDEAKDRFSSGGGRAIRDKYVKFINNRFREEGINAVAKIGWKSSIYITLTGIDKGFGLAALSAALGADFKDILYFGDAFKPDDNDEPALKCARKAANVGAAVDIFSSVYYKEGTDFVQFPDTGPAGFKMLCEKMGDIVHRELPRLPENGWANCETPAVLLNRFKVDRVLLSKAGNREGVSMPEVAVEPTADHVALEDGFEALIGLCLAGLAPGEGEPKRYRISDIITGPDAIYSGRIIDVITGIICPTGAAGIEISLNSANVSKDEMSVLRERLRIELAGLFMENAMKTKVSNEMPTIRIWEGYATTEEQKAMLPVIKEKSRERGYDIDFVKGEKDLIDFALASKDKKNVVTIIPRDNYSSYFRANIANLVYCPVIFMDFYNDRLAANYVSHLAGIIATAIAYVNDDEIAFKKLYRLLTDDYSYRTISLSELKKYAYLLTFKLKPTAIEGLEDLKRLQKKMLEILTSA